VVTNCDSRGLPLGSPWLGHVYEIWRVDHEQVIGLFFGIYGSNAVGSISEWVGIVSSVK